MTEKKLGRIRPKAIYDTPQFRIIVLHDGRVKVAVKLAHYYSKDKDIAPPPVVTNWLAKALAVIAEMYGNSAAGDCVIASLLHQIGVWTANESGVAALSNEGEALATYGTICGPGDQGCNITDVLDYAKATGVPLSGVLHKIAGYVAIDSTSQNEVQVAVEVFGPAIKLGINLPGAWMDAATQNGFVWDDTASPSIGGHDVPIIDVNEQGVVIATWAMWGTMTWKALANRNIVEEAWCALSPDWSAKGNVAPNGIDGATLAADLVLLGQGTIPPYGPVVPPVVPPVGPPVIPPVVPLVEFTLPHGARKGQRVTFGVTQTMPVGRYGVSLEGAKQENMGTVAD